ncbi:MAG: glycogen/starch/alpha-glucan phosphorylase, partial [Clostridiales bacterium]|nr:glycogen/starch/alpha-glucan phosphorylase [Clostridiales bacterium]
MSSNILFDKEKFKEEVKDNVRMLFRKKLSEATDQEIFQGVSYTVKDVIIDQWLATQQTFDREDPKMVYYMSMEFLMGRALGNNLINLTAYKQVREALDEMGINLDTIEDQEHDPALGNGGLGRLAACFVDSLATLGYAAYGCGIRYRYGMFRQAIVDDAQVEKPDNWLKNGYPFELRRPEHAFLVKFGGYVRSEPLPNGKTKYYQENCQTVRAVPYDIPVVGYGNNVVNTLMIWDAEPTNEFQLDSFDKGDYHKAVEQENLARNLVEVLYPNDNHIQGKELRLKQQYFFVSASVQRAVARYKKYHPDIKKMYEKVVIQMNDTHPTVAVAELMRILMD